MTPSTPPGYAGHRFPAEVVSHAVWLCFRLPLGLRQVDALLAARGVVVSRRTVRRWSLEFGQAFADQLRRPLPRAPNKRHLDEVAVTALPGWHDHGCASSAPRALLRPWPNRLTVPRRELVQTSAGRRRLGTEGERPSAEGSPITLTPGTRA